MTTHYFNQFLAPVYIRYVGNSTTFHPNTPDLSKPFAYTGTPTQLLDLFLSGDFVLAKSSTIQVVTIDLVPNAPIDILLDSRIAQLLAYNPVPDTSPPGTFFVQGGSYNLVAGSSISVLLNQ